MVLTKIVYFDKETINNILEERNKGSKTTQMDISSTMSANVDASVEASSKVKMEVPFLARLSFLFTGKIALGYALSKDKTTTITSTEISDFERIKRDFKEFKRVQVYDIENSSTSLRVAGGYMRMMKPCVDEKDTSKKCENKVIQCGRKDGVVTNKARKSWVFQNDLSFQKFYAPEMQNPPFADGVNSLSTNPRAVGLCRQPWGIYFFRHCYICFVCL